MLSNNVVLPNNYSSQSIFSQYILELTLKFAAALAVWNDLDQNDVKQLPLKSKHTY